MLLEYENYFRSYDSIGVHDAAGLRSQRRSRWSRSAHVDSVGPGMQWLTVGISAEFVQELNVGYTHVAKDKIPTHVLF